MTVRKGDTLIFDTPPVIRVWASAGGKKEAEGPLAEGFDLLFPDSSFNSCKWEQAESILQQKCVGRCLKKAALDPDQIDLAFAGDLQAQCTASNYTMRALGAPYAGLYGACSTMAEGISLAACFAAAGYARQVLAFTSSHFCAAERQFRTPLDYGGKRPPTAQWTATAAGACILAPGGSGVSVHSVTLGRVQDYDVHDISNMGAAMMPAAVSTLVHHFEDTDSVPADYDAVFTGDLGEVGTGLLHRQMHAEGYDLTNHRDCGCLLYNVARQQVQAGGSGAGCSAAVLCAYVLPRLADGRWKRVLFLSTGALMSQTTYLQGESIPGIAHAVELRAQDGADGVREG